MYAAGERLGEVQKGTNMTQTRKGIGALLAAVLAVAIGVLGMLSTPFANAQENFDASQKGSIIVHKYENPQWGSNYKNDGTKLNAPAGAKAMGGVKFKVQKVENLDLTAADGYTIASKLTLSNDKAKATDGTNEYSLGAATEQTTDTNGELTFSNLVVGVYLVTETDTGDHNVSKKAAPFFVSIPMPNNGNWLYDVNVYPKNEVASSAPAKELDDGTAYGVGDIYKWDLHIGIPTLANDTARFEKAGFSDPLSPYLKFDSAVVTAGTETLAAGTDYTLSVDPASKDDLNVTTSQKVDVSLTPGGLAKLKNHQGQKLNLQLKTLITGIPDNGQIVNKAKMYINDFTTPDVPTPNPGPGDDPIPTVTGYQASIEVCKVSEKGNKPLAGATFRLYNTRENAENGGTDGIVKQKVGEKTVDELTSDKDGKITFKAVVDKETKQRTYYLRETKAPEGYVLPKDPVTAVTFKHETQAGASSTGTVVLKPTQQNITNTQSTGPNLPLTGGTGQLIMGFAGVLVLGAAGGLYVTRRRRQQA